MSVELKNNKTGKMQEVQLLVSNICRSKEQQNWQDPGSSIVGTSLTAASKSVQYKRSLAYFWNLIQLVKFIIFTGIQDLKLMTFGIYSDLNILVDWVYVKHEVTYWLLVLITTPV